MYTHYRYKSSYDIIGEKLSVSNDENKTTDLQEVHRWYVNVLSASFYTKSPTILQCFQLRVKHINLGNNTVLKYFFRNSFENVFKLLGAKTGLIRLVVSPFV